MSSIIIGIVYPESFLYPKSYLLYAKIADDTPYNLRILLKNFLTSFKRSEEYLYQGDRVRLGYCNQKPENVTTIELKNLFIPAFKANYIALYYPSLPGIEKFSTFKNVWLLNNRPVV